jgi:uncharacterized protein
MLFVVIFTDKVDHGGVRTENLNAHIDWLEKKKTSFLLEGHLGTS